MSLIDRLMAAPWSWPGAGLALLACAGVWLIVAGLPHRRRPTLDDRLEPYLRDTPRPSKLLSTNSVPAHRFTGAALVAPLVKEAANGLERILGGASSVRRRLLRAGKSPDVERFRAEQVLCGVAGALVGLVLCLALAARRGFTPVPLALLFFICTAIGVIARDHWLTRAANEREARMLAEFPTIAEMLALAVGAGEGAIGALERVCRLSTGELASELRLCLADARAGANLPTALQGLADRTGLIALSRFVDGIVVAVERGTPLADVLRAQAQDVREMGRRQIMEEGGRKEIAMMVPVVFLVLPVTILFALYPGFVALRFTL